MAMQYLQRLAEVSLEADNFSMAADACMRLGHLLSLEVGLLSTPSLPPSLPPLFSTTTTLLLVDHHSFSRS